MIKLVKGPYKIPIDKDVIEKYQGVSAYYVRVKVEPKADYKLEEAIEKTLKNLNLELEKLKDHPKIRAYRDFYWRVGIDPTKQRPASEALIRRLLKKHSLPKISYIVDSGNLASVETFVPIGIYDCRFVRGGLRLRFAMQGEKFVDVVGNERMLNAGEIVLADDEGPLHIFPYRDSYRTRVREDTNEVYVVACGVGGIGVEELRKALDRVVYWLSSL